MIYTTESMLIYLVKGTEIFFTHTDILGTWQRSAMTDTQAVDKFYRKVAVSAKYCYIKYGMDFFKGLSCAK